MNKNMQTITLVVVTILVLIPTGVIAKNYVIDRYSTLENEGVVACSVAALWEDKNNKEVKPSPTPPIPSPKDCKCKGTKKVKSGDGILDIPCPCGSTCTCGTGSLPKTARTPSVRLVLFGSRNCVPCRQMHASTRPGLEKKGWRIGTNPENHIQVVDIDLDQVTASRYKIPSIPCIIRLEDEKAVGEPYLGYINAGGFTRVWEGRELTQGDRLYKTY